MCPETFPPASALRGILVKEGQQRANTKAQAWGIINTKENARHEKLIRTDHKYDLLIPIKYNFKKPISGKGSCIFIHLTKDYKPTAGCITLKKKDFLIMLKLINKKTKIKIV